MAFDFSPGSGCVAFFVLQSVGVNRTVHDEAKLAEEDK
jgi:hypothetical protein